MFKKEKIKVFLQDIDCPCLIIKANTGVVYTNQCEGTACTHNIAEGFIYPMPIYDKRYLGFLTEWGQSNFDDCIDDLMKYLEMSMPCDDIHFVGTPIEAWVPLKIKGAQWDCYGMKDFEAVLVWDNSD